MIKRLILLFLLSICCGTTAQTFNFEGFRTGLNMSTITHSDLGYRAGFYGSALATLNFKDIYAMQFEVGYSRQGASGTETIYTVQMPAPGEPDMIISKTYHNPTLHYLTFGVMNRFKITPKFYGYIGGSAEFLLAHPERYTNDGDFVWNLGFSYDINEKFSVEVRAKKGMFHVISDSYDYRTDEDDIHGTDPITNTNLVFQAGIIYRLHFTYTDVKNLFKK